MTKETQILEQKAIVAELKIEAEMMQKQALEAAELKLKVAGAFEYVVVKYRNATEKLAELEKEPVKEKKTSK